VITGTPIDLGRLIDSRHPIRHARYELKELESPTLEQVLAPLVEKETALRALA
jgi:predicted GTPase